LNSVVVTLYRIKLNRVSSTTLFGSHQRHLPPSIWQIFVFCLPCATPDNEA